MPKQQLAKVTAADGAVVTAYAVGDTMLVECSRCGELPGSGGNSRALASQYAKHHAHRDHTR